jgi:mercuric ion transport protein
MPSTSSKTALSTAGGVAAALGSTLCCAGPLVAVLLGVSGAGLARTFEPLRPVFVLGTVAAFGYAHWTLHRAEAQACEPGSPCAAPRVRAWTKWTLWIGTVLAVPLLLFPWWSRFVLG